MAELSAGGERLLDVATEVFYAEGIRATGVDTLVARAGVSKPTMYAQFGSKENLVAAVLDRRRAQRQEALTRFLDRTGAEGVERLLAVFDWLAEGHGRDGFRGCPFTNAAVELPDPDHPARRVISAYKEWLRGTLTELAAGAELDRPEEVGDALLLLVDGANARVVVADDRAAMRRAKAAATRIVGLDGEGAR
ncbi:DNA-binding transcriptional regulator, AcrR family [Amycolatopsis arida]|uniref:DNA-binding transcriptional regulator, AcrR family n=1 Tax=Amycolatopsis arida TaxID=587909 RepID=A0A1I5QEM6_9PSEU|nr:TetR/AcrR family transcriptional regulator [Amycolatopsis arida]TDX98813.1 AcrR family transcriptional regulator [Amycolatopsis arida]SFP44749.1 DNA-binding transcriptional regulator, AcrR family [Amycolatopsis arida]